MADEACIRCQQAPAVTNNLCGHCHWAVKAEIEDGLVKFRAYLQAWADFNEWCRTREASA